MLNFRKGYIVQSLISGVALCFSTGIAIAANNLDTQDNSEHLILAGLTVTTKKPEKTTANCSGIFISYSTGSGQLAADGTGKNSPYTLALANQLVKPDISLQKISKEVRKSVIRDAKINHGSGFINQKPMYVDDTGCEYQLANKQDKRPKVALVIGNAVYATASSLNNPGNDGQLIASKLTELGFGVNLMINGGVNQMNAAIKELKTKMKTSANGAVAVIYYAGHGVQVDGEQYWVPVDVDNDNSSFEDLEFQVISLNKLVDYELADKSLIVIFNDTVRNNPFVNSSR